MSRLFDNLPCQLFRGPWAECAVALVSLVGKKVALVVVLTGPVVAAKTHPSSQ